MKLKIYAQSAEAGFLDGRYSQSFVDELNRQVTDAISRAMSVEGLDGSSIELELVFAPATYMEHTNENVTYRRLLMSDKGCQPRDFWVKWTRLDSAVGYTVSDEVSADTILFELGEDVSQKVREKEYRFLCFTNPDKYQAAMGKKRVTEWRDLIKRAIKKGDLIKVELPEPEADNAYEADIMNLLGNDTPSYNAPDTYETTEADDEIARMARAAIGADEPEYIEEPVAMDEPEYTEESVVMDEPEYIEEPVVMDEPEYTEEPVVMDEPEYTEEPVVMDEPEYIEEPVVMDEPEYTEEPVAMDEPEYTEAPFEYEVGEDEPETPSDEDRERELAELERLREERIRAEVEARVRLEYEAEARARAEAEAERLRLEHERLKRENERLLEEARLREERIRREEEERREAEAERLRQEQLRREEEEKERARREEQSRREAEERARFAEAARAAVEEQRRLERERLDREERERAEILRLERERLEREEAERRREAAIREQERMRLEEERRRAAMPPPVNYITRHAKLIFRRNVDVNVIKRIKEIIENTLVKEHKEHIHIHIKAFPVDSYTINLDIMKLPENEGDLLVTIIKAIGNGGLGITKIILE